jgi:hypothetical protein
MGMKNLQRWAAGKPIALAFVAQPLAAWADDVYGALEALRSGVFGNAFGNPPPVSEWLRFYREHRHLQKVVLETFPLNFGGLALTNDAVEITRNTLRDFACMTPAEWDELMKGNQSGEFKKALSDAQETVGEAAKTFFEGVDEWSSGNIFPEEVLSRAIKLPEIQFIVRVVWPCWMEYGVPATKMLFKARHAGKKGKNFEKEQPWEAMENLACLDAATVHEQRIKDAYNSAAVANNIHFDDVTRGLAGSPNRKITVGNVKSTIGAFIQRASELINFPLSAPEIRRLFDVIAQDRKKGIRDNDLPSSDKAWALAVLRARPLWNPFFPSNKKA